MIYSMTGQGRAKLAVDGMEIEAEVRSVNNRFLKVTFKLTEPLSPFELAMENLVREHLKRGSVHVFVRYAGTGQSQTAAINTDLLQHYLSQTIEAVRKTGQLLTLELGSVLNLPGVLVPGNMADDGALSDLTLKTLTAALLDLNRMRQTEGSAMGRQLGELVRSVRELRGQIETRAPEVIAEYRKRLETRVRTALNDLGHSADELDILREVLQFSDRCDVREELVRLSSHLDRFEEALDGAESQGRRLDFLIQEIFRETNTIGAKANDATIAHYVVSIKTSVEQMRELVQNVE
ncbi:MAG: hypothetical protein RL240_292 [Planctomycetota bacterium]|jgi:uncharacterized protein (TIGR00255 family)